MRRTPGEQYVATFGLATNREWNTKDGRKMQSAEFHDLVCWGRLAEISKQYLTKGKLIHVEGYLKTRSWDDASGMKKFRTEVVVEDLIMLDKRPSSVSDFAPAEHEKGSIKNESAEAIQPAVMIDDSLAI